MKNWRPYKISDFIEINPSVKLSKNESYSFVEMRDLTEGIKYVEPSQIKELKGGGARFQEKDTLFARITPCLENGKISQVKNLKNGKGFGSTEFLVFRGKDGVSNTDFAYYLSLSKIFRNFAEQNMVGTSGRQRVSKDVFSKLELVLPPLPTQKAIAEILSSLDDKIELNNQINQNLEALAQAIFKQWFVDFEFPNENREPYKSSGGEMVDSELGEIPKGWEIDFLTKFLNVVYGKNLPTTNLTSDGFPVFGGNGIIGFYSKFHYEKPQVLISCRGAASGKINFSKPRSFITNNSLVIEIPDGSIIPFEFLRQWSLNQDFTSFVSGSAQPQITIENLKPLQLLIPSHDILENFKKVVEPFLIQIKELDRENIELKNLRDTLLPKLISGELEINHVNLN